MFLTSALETFALVVDDWIRQGPAILDGKLEPAFPLKHAQKDMRFAVVSYNSISLSSLMAEKLCVEASALHIQRVYHWRSAR